jgi:hypothetical protein
MNEDAADALLGAVLNGELAAEDPRVVRLLRDEPWRREELAAARAGLDAVRGAEPGRRAVLAAARAMATAPGAERLPALLAQHVAARGRLRRRGVLALVLLGAAAVAAVLLLRSGSPARDAAPEYLGGLGDERLSPRGIVTDTAWPEFRWSIEGDGYQLEVFELRDDRTRGRRIATVQGIVGRSWHPDGRLTAQTRRIEWVLHVSGPNGQDDHFARASLH